MDELIQAIREQTAAINALVESNQRMMLMILEGESLQDMPNMPIVTYLDGSNAG